VQSQLLIIGSSAKTLKLWWQNGRRLTDWSNEASTPKGVPLPFRRRGGTRVHTLKVKTFSARLNQPVKAGWQCGQQAKDSALPYCSQAHKITFALK